jgi:putative tryptophan/tyrosine transport system substrate-binding protein
MRRREFITLIGGAAAAWPLTARAQQSGKLWRVGMLDTAARELNTANVIAFQKGLRQFGFVEPENLVIEYRSAEGQYERLPDLVSELLRLKVDVIVVRGTVEIVAVKNATSTTPVVMSAVGDPVAAGIVANLAHPGGNITGLSSLTSDLEVKRYQFLKELLPGVKRVGNLQDPEGRAASRLPSSRWNERARSLAIEVHDLDVRNITDLSGAFDLAIKQRVEAMRVGLSGITRTNQKLVIDLAAQHKLPTIYQTREFVENGGLISYGVSYPDLYFRAASFVSKILNGAKPGDLPVEQPTNFELVVNLKTAKELGLTIPPSIMARADEVIE